jgi:hypothetical protein
MATHGQAAAGFDKQDSYIIRGVRRRIKDTSAHHVMTPGLKHQTFSNPVVLLQKMDSLLGDGIAL